jgi:exonuclease III
MPEEFLWKQDIDLAFVQEVTTPLLSAIRRYTAYVNEGTDMRGTAILVKDGIPITDIKRIPSGRGMAAIPNGTWIVNIYAPSGAEKKNGRESFYNTDLTYILHTTHADMIIAGDFNCILSKRDSTGTNNYSRALANILNGLGLIDAWNTSTSRRMYTYYTATGASRIDRIYATRNNVQETGFRNGRSCIYRQSRRNPAHCNKRTFNTARQRLLANERSQYERQKLPDYSTKTMGKMENT